ncbi:MAG: cation diffusion facilitator family transporter [Phycisphaerae bacterium]
MHDHGHREVNDRLLYFAVAINVLLTVAQVVGGVLSGSYALIADGLHNFSDAGSIVIAVVARRMARRPPDAQRTFGYGRAEVIGALVNTTVLIIVGLYLLYEAVERYLHPQPIDGWVVIVVAAIALVIDVLTGLLIFRTGSDLNLRAAFLHNVADALGSLVVIGVGFVVLRFGWQRIDALATGLIAVYVLYQSWGLFRDSVRILMDSVPANLRLTDVERAMRDVPGVHDVHHVHLRQLDEHRNALEAHVVVATPLRSAQKLIDDLNRVLAERFEISHTTLQIEPDIACDEKGVCAVESDSRAG